MLKKGFTLVELIVVMGVLGVIVTALIVAFNPLEQLAKSKDARRKSDLAQIQKALELYYQDNNEYPESSFDNLIVIEDEEVDWGEDMAPYLKTLPKDPSSGKRYVYKTDTTNQSYWIYASLDRPNDPQACSNGNECPNASGLTCNKSGTGAICNYGVSSPNVSI